MLKIRTAQMEALSRVMLRQFEERMVQHLQAVYPEHLQDVAEVNLRAMIQSGISNAREYGVIAEDDIRRYLELMAVYGADFDVAPRTSWAGEILQLKGLDGSAKIDRLDEYDLFLSIRDMT